MAIKNDRFIVVYQQDFSGVKIVADRTTNVQYLHYFNGLTVLVDQQGKPLLYEPPSV